MKTKTYGLLLLLCLINSKNAKAQTWQWIAASNNPNGWYSMGNFVIDGNNNIYSAGSIGFGATGSVASASFGTNVMYSIDNKSHFIVAKTDSQGNFKWIQYSENASVAPIGIAEGRAGTFYVLGIYGGFYNDTALSMGGITISNPDHATKRYMYFLAKLDTVGNVVWLQNVLSTSYEFYSNEIMGKVGADTAGNVYIAGKYADSSVTDIFLAKYTPSGALAWAKGIGGSGVDGLGGVAISRSGNMYLAGIIDGTSFTAGTDSLPRGYSCGGYLSDYFCKFNSAGTLVWLKHPDDSGGLVATSLAADDNDNIFLTGYYGIAPSFGSFSVADSGAITSFILAKYDAAGNPLWAKTSIGHASDAGMGVSTDQCGHIWTYGIMGDWESGIPDTGYKMNFDGFVLTAPPYSRDPMFIAEYEPDGNFMNAIALPLGGNAIKQLLPDNTGHVVIGGTFAVDTFKAGNLFLPPGNNAEELVLAKLLYSTANDTILTGCDSLISPNTTITLQGPGGFDNYVWSDHSTGIHNSVDSGYYWVECSQTCPYNAYRVDSFYVSYSDLLSVGNSPSVPEVVSVFPNPTFDQWQLSVPQSLKGNFTVIVADVNNKVIRTLTNTTVIDASSIPVGTYIVKIISDNKVYSLKAVKK